MKYQNQFNVDHTHLFCKMLCKMKDTFACACFLKCICEIPNFFTTSANSNDFHLCPRVDTKYFVKNFRNKSIS